MKQTLRIDFPIGGDFSEIQRRAMQIAAQKAIMPAMLGVLAMSDDEVAEIVRQEDEKNASLSDAFRAKAH